MMTEQPKRVAVVCGTDSAQLSTFCNDLRQNPGWAPLPVQDPDLLDVSERAQADAYIVLGAEGELGQALLQKLGARPVHRPLFSFGGITPPELNATLSMAGLPSSKILAGILESMAPRAEAAAPARTWRRKSDMIIGISGAVSKLLQHLDRLARAVVPVLITGESGTGKELVARALHFSGPRAGRPFLPINCGAIPEALFESELFGYERGAFTGATASRPGVFESAQGGTVFLDEIGEMPLSLQVKLLRVLERSEVTRLGSTVVKHVDFRLVTATNRPLEEAVRTGRFREDLYYRIRVYPIHVPPLRERSEDIAPLVRHHLALICEKNGLPAPVLTEPAFEKLGTHPWPGNVRELINVLQHAMLLAEHEIRAEHIHFAEPPAPAARASAPEPLLPFDQARAGFERAYYERLLGACSGNVSAAAKLAGKTRKQIYEAIRRHGLEPAAFRAEQARLSSSSEA